LRAGFAGRTLQGPALLGPPRYRDAGCYKPKPLALNADPVVNPNPDLTPPKFTAPTQNIS